MGCLTPSLRQPEIVSDLALMENFVQSESLDFDGDADSSRVEWWKRFEQSELNAWVDELLSENYDLAVAMERIEQARAIRNQSIARLLPSLSASAGVQRDQTPNSSFDDFNYSTLYTGGATVGWDTDLFGQLRNSERSAYYSAQSAALNYRSLEQLYIAELVRAWIAVQTIGRRIELNNIIVESFSATANVSEQRYRAGSSGTSATDVQITKANLLSAQANLPELESASIAQYHALDILLGRLPGTTRAGGVSSMELPNFDPVPVGTPATLLADRPDVAAAELSYRAALSDVGAARAQLFPGLSLTARLSFQETDSSDLFDWDRHIGSLIGSLTAPIFQGGALRAQLDQAWSVARQVSYEYASVALNAVVDVENALTAERNLDRQVLLLRDNVEAAELANQIANDRYRDGLVPLLTVLETQRNLNSSLQNLILTEQSRWNARVNLYLALGGDWVLAEDRQDSSSSGNN